MGSWDQPVLPPPPCLWHWHNTVFDCSSCQASCMPKMDRHCQCQAVPHGLCHDNTGGCSGPSGGPCISPWSISVQRVVLGAPHPTVALVSGGPWGRPGGAGQGFGVRVPTDCLSSFESAEPAAAACNTSHASSAAVLSCCLLHNKQGSIPMLCYVL